jgi:hypothetical protein
MTTIEESIDIQVPIRTVYDQWTQFEEFHRSWRGEVSNDSPSNMLNQHQGDMS